MSGSKRVWHPCLAQSKARGENRPDSDFITNYRLEFQRLPCWQALDDAQYRKTIRALLDEATDLAIKMRGEKAQSLGPDGVAQQDPHDKPKVSKKSPRPLCHASTFDMWKAFRETYKEFVRAYRIASAILRAGDDTAEFPPNAFLPPLGFDWVPQPP